MILLGGRTTAENASRQELITSLALLPGGLARKVPPKEQREGRAKAGFSRVILEVENAVGPLRTASSARPQVLQTG